MFERSSAEIVIGAVGCGNAEHGTVAGISDIVVFPLAFFQDGAFPVVIVDF